MKLLHVHLLSGLLMILASAAAVGLQTDWGSSVSSPMLAAFLVWPGVPITIAMGAGCLLRRSRAALICCLLGLSAAFCLMAALYVNAFYLNLDPQSALIILFGPVYALVLLIPFGLAALCFHFRSRGGRFEGCRSVGNC